MNPWYFTRPNTELPPQVDPHFWAAATANRSDAALIESLADDLLEALREREQRRTDLEHAIQRRRDRVAEPVMATKRKKPTRSQIAAHLRPVRTCSQCGAWHLMDCKGDTLVCMMCAHIMPAEGVADAPDDLLMP